MTGDPAIHQDVDPGPGPDDDIDDYDKRVRPQFGHQHGNQLRGDRPHQR